MWRIAARRLSVYDVSSDTVKFNFTPQLITHLPLAVRPDNLCFNADGRASFFVTGDGADAVAVVFYRLYRTPEVAETLLVGHDPGPMAVSQAYLFVASPSAGDVVFWKLIRGSLSPWCRWEAIPASSP